MLLIRGAEAWKRTRQHILEAWEIIKPFFHWRISQVFIPVWFSTGVGMVLADKFSPAYSFFVLFGAWSLLCWFASDYLTKEKRNLKSRAARRSRTYRKRRVQYTMRKWGMTIFILLVTGAGVFGAREVENSYDLMQLRGMLLPAGDPTPPNGCTGGAAPKDGVVLLLGDSGNGVWVNSFPATAIAYNWVPILTLDRNGAGDILVSVKVFDKHENLIASIDKNEFNVANHALWTHKPRPDKSTLIVFDESGEEVLYVRNLNDKAIVIRGSLYLGGAKRPIDWPGGSKNTCMIGFRTAVDIDGPPQEIP